MRFFHFTAMVKGQRNQISSLKHHGGGWSYTENKLQKKVVGYYKELFKKQSSSHVDKVLVSIDP